MCLTLHLHPITTLVSVLMQTRLRVHILLVMCEWLLLAAAASLQLPPNQQPSMVTSAAHLTLCLISSSILVWAAQLYGMRPNRRTARHHPGGAHPDGSPTSQAAQSNKMMFDHDAMAASMQQADIQPGTQQGREGGPAHNATPDMPTAAMYDAGDLKIKHLNRQTAWIDGVLFHDSASSMTKSASTKLTQQDLSGAQQPAVIDPKKVVAMRLISEVLGAAAADRVFAATMPSMSDSSLDAKYQGMCTVCPVGVKVCRAVLPTAGLMIQAIVVVAKLTT